MRPRSGRVSEPLKGGIRRSEGEMGTASFRKERIRRSVRKVGGIFNI